MTAHKEPNSTTPPAEVAAPTAAPATVPAWRTAQVALPATLIVGFVFWGPEGHPWLLRPFTLPPHIEGMLSFAIGALFMAVIPALVLRYVCKERLTDYGLGLGRVRKGLILMVALSGLSIPVMALAAGDPTMQGEYPLFDPVDHLLTYEAAYLLFFVAGEVAMRGYVLFGVRRWTGSTAQALVWSTMLQAVWHLSKPLPEMLAAPFWGLLIGLLCLHLRSVWYALVFHYVANVALDLWIISAH